MKLHRNWIRLKSQTGL